MKVGNPRRATALLLSLILAGCGSDEVMPQAPDGYDAIKFQRTIEVRDHSVNTFTFASGSVFVADRRSSYGVMYCGNISTWGTIVFKCFGVEPPSTLVIGPGGGPFEVRRPQPPGTFERIKVKL